MNVGEGIESGRLATICWRVERSEFTTYSEIPARTFSFHAAMDAHAEAIAPRPPVYPERRTPRQP